MRILLISLASRLQFSSSSSLSSGLFKRVPFLSLVVTKPFFTSFQDSKNSENKKNQNEIQQILDNLYSDTLPKEFNKVASPSFEMNYEEFQNETSRIIYDIDEEIAIQRGFMVDESISPSKIHSEDLKQKTEKFTRGNKGVFDLSDLVATLRKEKCQDIVSLVLDSKIGYVNEMVIVTCKNKRHLRAVASFVRRLFKVKRNDTDSIPVIEGNDFKDSEWLAMDLGNIALHLFLEKERVKYDLESLWALGPQHDDQCQNIEREDDDEKKHTIKDYISSSFSASHPLFDLQPKC